MHNENIHLFADFTLDLARGCLLCAGNPVHLRPQAYEVLKHLAENKGRLVGKDSLIEIVWRGRAVTDDALVQCLLEVRNALGANGKLYVRNVRGRGYIFDPPACECQKSEDSPILTGQGDLLRVVGEDEKIACVSKTDQTASQVAGLTEPAATAATTEASAAHTASSADYLVSSIQRHKRAAIIALTVLALSAAGVVYSTRFAPREQEIRSVAVLPFANESGDPNLEYLSDGLSESLIDRLSQLPSVKVIARTSSFKYKGQEFDPREVARALGVQALVTGRVVQRGDDLQVRAELVDTREGTQVWGEQYSRRMTDIQGVQEEIGRTISEKLRLRLSGGQERQLTKHATQSPQAYQLYLNGLFFVRKGGFENTRKALDYFNQAVVLDPNFAPAWVGVARAHSAFAVNSLLEPQEALAKAKAAVHKALELDETLAEAHAMLGGIKQNEWNWAGAEWEYKRAVELNPNLAEAHFRYSEYLSIMGRHTEALAEVKRVHELDPLQDSLRTREAWTLFLARRYDEAMEKLQKAVKLNPDSPGPHHYLGFTYIAKGMYEQGVEEFQKANSLPGETPGNLYFGFALAKSGRRSEAKAILDKLLTTKEYVSPTELAELYVGLGDTEAAIASLERAYAAHDLQLQTLRVSPNFDTLRSDRRFQDLMRRVGLPL